jgi:AraC-like DNA-binding protein
LPNAGWEEGSAKRLVQRWLADVYDPGKDLPRLLGDLLSAGAEAIDAPRLGLCLHAPPVGDGSEGQFLIVGCPPQSSGLRDCQRCRLDPPAGDNGLLPPCRPPVFAAIPRRRRSIGIVFALSERRDRRHLAEVCRELANEAGRLAQRAQLRMAARSQFARDLCLLGTRRMLTRLDVFLEHAAPLPLPVMVRGQPGSGRSEIARALHLLGRRSGSAFVAFDCRGWNGRDFLTELHRRRVAAAEGTLYLADVEQLPLAAQADLAQAAATAVDAAPAGARWIVACPPAGGRAASALHPRLAEELGLLTFQVETDGAGEAPRLVRLGVDLPGIEPWLPDDSALSRSCAVSGGPPPSLAERCHPALARAVAILAANAAEPLTVAEVAARVHLSPSHLAHLFRGQLDTTLVRLLNGIRIERAKLLLLTDPTLTVTEAAQQAGFSDLRHFQRTFKRSVGTTPRAFRRGRLAARPTGGLGGHEPKSPACPKRSQI